MNEEENPIHLMFGYGEALMLKREILYLQRSLLGMNDAMKGYFSLNDEGVKLKSLFHKKLREASTIIKKLQKGLPEVEMPEILRKEDYHEDLNRKSVKQTLYPKKPSKTYDSSIESQLQEIQKKLKILGSD